MILGKQHREYIPRDVCVKNCEAFRSTYRWCREYLGDDSIVPSENGLKGVISQISVVIFFCNN